jgi:hypothetical protein
LGETIELVLGRPQRGQWHDLKIWIAGTNAEGYLDGKLYLEHVLPQPVSGRIGLWSKADSHMYFDNYMVTPVD